MRSQLVVILFLSVIITGFAQQAGEFHSYVPQQDGPCLDHTSRELIKEQLSASVEQLILEGRLPSTSVRTTNALEWPLKSANNLDVYGYFGVSNFVDHDHAFPNAVTDYKCGVRSFDTNLGYNHAGTDIFLWPFGWKMMEEDQVEVIAAESGVIIGKDDGNNDQNCAPNSSAWNALYVQHFDGTQAWYGHLKKNSLTSKLVGDTILQSEYIGVVGSSGNSSGPHLHLELYDEVGELIDPYSGNCNNLNTDSWWADQNPYYNSAINKLSTHHDLPFFNECPSPAQPNEEEDFCGNDQIYFMAYLRDQLENQSLIHQVIRPDNSIYAQWANGLEGIDHFPASFVYQPLNLPPNPMEGVWTYEIEYNNITYTHNFNVCLSTNVEDLEANTISSVFYPNPVEDDFTFSLFSNEQQTLTFEIYDSMGRKHSSLQKECSQGPQYFQFNSNHLSQGIHFFVTKNDAGEMLSSHRFVLKSL